MSEIQADREFADGLSGETKLPAIEWLAEQMPGGFFIFQAYGTKPPSFRR
ncbi:MAG: hypothetical protein IJ679_01400 [Lachnospiraceae bacterium]|nr:hypothetical protein [Lachnospiraceae bacterium]